MLLQIASVSLILAALLGSRAFALIALVLGTLAFLV